MSDKDLIRKAAAVLRERALAATPGPWVETGYGDYGPGVRFSGSDTWDPGGVECSDSADGWATAAYLPLVAPEFGLAVADWLEDAPSRRDFSRAARVARAVVEAVERTDAAMLR